ncbi:MAG TPA: transglycosylase SLT domain-containing protein [Bacteroidia bacterium]|jgi:membrane-bound lytic murein transglycosylase D|nr:transglycosylase SLT domain-containing protein [Bacteroidia bacterium]
MRMTRIGNHIILSLTIFMVIASGFAKAAVIHKNVGPGPKDSAQILADDPIAASLDSLSALNFFEKGYDLIKSPNYNFRADSIPVYSEKEIAERFSKLDGQTPFDLEYNNVVKEYVDLYAVRKKQLTSRVLALSRLYFPMEEQILDRYKMPLELKYLSVVESALNPTACSKCGARGLWQFMYTTGKLYNLSVSSYVDERNDPYKETVAACEYLKFLYGMFGDWQLVIAAYNCGPGEISKAIRRSGGKTNFWAIRPYLPKETQNYVPAFIAVNYVMHYATSLNISPSIVNATYFDVDTVAVHEQLSFSQISSYLNVPLATVAYLNPSYKLGVVPYSADAPYTICLPVSKAGTFITNEKTIYNLCRKDTLTSTQIMALQETSPQVEYYRVKHGEHLSTIANRYHCTVHELKEWNGLASNNVAPGQHLTVYVNRGHKAAASTTNVASKKISTKKDYTVQAGDTLWHISQTTGIPVATLKKLNPNNSLVPGTKIKLSSN